MRVLKLINLKFASELFMIFSFNFEKLEIMVVVYKIQLFCSSPEKFYCENFEFLIFFLEIDTLF